MRIEGRVPYNTGKDYRTQCKKLQAHQMAGKIHPWCSSITPKIYTRSMKLRVFQSTWYCTALRAYLICQRIGPFMKQTCKRARRTETRERAIEKWESLVKSYQYYLKRKNKEARYLNAIKKRNWRIYLIYSKFDWRYTWKSSGMVECKLLLYQNWFLRSIILNSDALRASSPSNCAQCVDCLLMIFTVENGVLPSNFSTSLILFNEVTLSPVYQRCFSIVSSI